MCFCLYTLLLLLPGILLIYFIKSNYAIVNCCRHFLYESLCLKPSTLKGQLTRAVQSSLLKEADIIHFKDIYHKLNKSLNVHSILSIPLDSRDNRSIYGGSAPCLIGKRQTMALYYLSNCSVKGKQTKSEQQCKPKESTEALCGILIKANWTSGRAQQKGTRVYAYVYTVLGAIPSTTNRSK